MTLFGSTRTDLKRRPATGGLTGSLCLIGLPLLFCGLALPRVVDAAPSAFDLMKRSDKRHRIPLERTESRMLLQKKGDKPRERRVVSVTVQDDKDGDRMRVRFAAPKTVEGTATLTVENTRGGDDEQWLYLPAFRRTRRVGTAELGDRFVGTDFFYEDLKRRHVEDFSYKILRSEQLDGQACWVIESRPKAPKVIKESPYGKSVIWLRKDNLFVLRVRMSDRRMRPWKEMRMTGVKRVKGKAWRADKVTVVDIRRKHRSVIMVTRRQLDVKLSPGTFSKHKLADPI